MNKEHIKEFLVQRGWSTWYSENYWIHKKLIADATRQDYTNYGLTLEDAYSFETKDMKPFTGQYLGYRFQEE